MRVADYLMLRLAQAGARDVFVLPGGGAMHLNDGLACQPLLRAIPCHHEQACAIAAEASGRIAGTFGVAMVTTGPGATNAVTPVAGAWIESVPMFVLSGQVKRADLLAGRPLRQGGVQEVDIVSMVAHVTKYAVTIGDPAMVRYHFERALHAMKRGRAGPVWLDVPLDVQAADVDPGSLIGYEANAEAGPVPSQDVAAIAELVGKAERPLALVGHGVRLAGAADIFLAWAERVGAPIATTWNALDLIPWDHPLCVGRPGVVALRAGNFAVQNCDLLLSIGCRLDSIVTAYNARGFARGAKKVVVDVDPNQLACLDMDTHIKVACDARAFLEAWPHASDAPAGAHAAWAAKCQQWKVRYSVERERPFSTTGPIGHYQAATALSEAIPASTLISTGSSGLAIEAFYTVFKNKPGQRVFLTSGLGAMGYGLPAAIGACLAHGSAPMVAIESDGSLQLNLQELATLRGQRLPICLIILNNAGYCSIRNTQRNYFQGRYLGTGPEAGLWMPDLADVARAYELPYLKIDDSAGLADRLREALRLPRPCIIDLRLIDDETLAPKVAAAQQPDGSMTSMPLEDMTPLLPLHVLESEMLVPLLAASRAAAR